MEEGMKSGVRIVIVTLLAPLFYAVFFLLSHPLVAQPPATLWTKTIGGGALKTYWLYWTYESRINLRLTIESRLQIFRKILPLSFFLSAFMAFFTFCTWPQTWGNFVLGNNLPRPIEFGASLPAITINPIVKPVVVVMTRKTNHRVHPQLGIVNDYNAFACLRPIAMSRGMWWGTMTF